ncbi:HAD family hydrolase [Robertkochia aurantiaca]|uniref:HAD family hydrolase n=1 Tax=Robertkochia aurantiaca TaxID=2873700 RepID=UPI001CCE73B0|nr:HAD family hydrolase [Robertkochia sp. 3YJGBD-33]
MNLENVKLVVSDMDGTLLNNQGEVSKEFFELFQRLEDRGIHFAAASGRQYHSIVNKLSAIKDRITVIAENGGIARQGNEELLITPLPSQYIADVIPVLRKVEGAFPVLCGKDSAYIETRDETFINMFREYYSEFKVVDELTRVNHDEFLKIAVYHFDGSEQHLYPLLSHLEKELQVKISGAHWLDLSHPDANKGFALEKLQNKMGLSKEETMVFGDYNNDLEMLDRAYFSYAMENAHPNVKKRARFNTGSNEHRGVESILEKLLRS